MWANSADDYINLPELGFAQRQVHAMSLAKLVLIPICDARCGCGTHTSAGIGRDRFVELLAESEPEDLSKCWQKSAATFIGSPFQNQ